jgi:hypothetical protein
LLSSIFRLISVLHPIYVFYKIRLY